MDSPQTPSVPMADRKALKDLPNVHATGFGPRVVDGERVTHAPTHLIVFVETKEERDALEESDLVPEAVDGVPTDVQENPRFEITREDPRRPSNPPDYWDEGSPVRDNTSQPKMLGGTAVSAVDKREYGSSTALMRDENGDPVIITNRHVVADGTEDPSGTDVGQGSSYSPDGPAPRVVGTVREVGEWDTESDTNTVDTAIVDVDPEEVSTGYLGYPSADPDTPIGSDGWWPARFDKPLVCVSARTGIASAELTAINSEATVGYDDFTVSFEGLAVYGPISAGGSSGSAIGYTDVDNETFHPAFLNFAGSQGKRGLGIPYEAIREEHGSITPDPAPRDERTFFEDEPTFFEAAPIQREQADSETVTVCVANIGLEGSGEVAVERYTGNGNWERRATLNPTLAGGEYRFIDIDIGSLSNGEHTLLVVTPDIEVTWPLRKRSTDTGGGGGGIEPEPIPADAIATLAGVPIYPPDEVSRPSIEVVTDDGRIGAIALKRGEDQGINLMTDDGRSFSVRDR